MPTKQCRKCQQEKNIPDTETLCQLCQERFKPIDKQFIFGLISGIENNYYSYTEMLINEADLTPEENKKLHEFRKKQISQGNVDKTEKELAATRKEVWELKEQIESKDETIDQLQNDQQTYYQNLQAKQREIQQEKSNLISQAQELTQAQEKISQLENEVATHLEALKTAQEWHERQKAELIEAKQMAEKDLNQSQELNQKLQQDNRDLLNDIHHYKQKNTTLENQLKTQTETLKKTQKELTEQKSLHQNHLTQEKTQLTKEIQLIKEALT
ncbi:MAG: hypothetical protein MRECE_19c016 [Mycoplasmataceae bacterium CE_OT135]|nr:MAG: hypothetical protein MRECE_19c016 [Mycoplasmataceae bacterium CE_OT135]